MKPITILCVFVSFLLSFGVFLTTAAASGTDLSDDEIANEIDTFVKEVMDCYSSPGLTLSVVKSGKTIISRGYGITRNPTGKENVEITSKTRFAIGSLTKAFTALLAVKLVTESNGSITVDTPIHDFMPGFRLIDDIRSKEASLKDLLSHRMAVPGYGLPLIMGLPPSMTRDDLFRRMPFLTSPLTFREKFIYNNYMYIVAGQVLEQLADGKSWEDQVRDVIFCPLNMSDSGFVTDVTDFADFALPCYREENDSITDLSPDLFSTAHIFGPAGTIYSNADDMTRWMNLMLSNGQRANPSGLGPEVTRQTFQAGSLANTVMTDLSKPMFPVSHHVSHYALGWIASSYRGYRQIYHTGGIVTHSSRLWLYPDLDIGIFLTTRGPESEKRDMLQSILYHASDLLIGEAPWFNASSACQRSSLPWKNVDVNVKKEETSRQEIDLISDTISNFTATGTLIPAHYVGNYSHPFFGVVQIFTDCPDTISDRNKTSLCFHYGRYGWMHLEGLNETLFVCRFYGPLAFMNPSKGEYEIKVTFSFNNPDFATSLELIPKHYNNIQFERLDDVLKRDTSNGHNVSWQISATIIIICFSWIMI